VGHDESASALAGHSDPQLVDEFEAISSRFKKDEQRQLGQGEEEEEEPKEEEAEEGFKPIPDSPSRIKLAETSSPLSFLFGGVGDGRHLFASLLDIADQLRALPESRQQQQGSIHFTLLDIKAAVIARNLVVLALLERLSTFDPATRHENEDAIMVSPIILSCLCQTLTRVRLVVCARAWRGFVMLTSFVFRCRWPRRCSTRTWRS
jgi:hypothetical protein